MELDKKASLDNIKELAGSLGEFLSELIVPIISIGGAILLVIFIIAPGIKNIQDDREEKLEKEELLQELEEKRVLLSRYSNQSQRLDTALGLVRHAIPLEDEVPEVMTQLQDTADLANVIVSNLTYKSGSRGDEDLDSVTLNLGVDGGYSRIEKLFELLEDSSRIVVAEQFNLRVQEEASVSATLSLKSFFMPAPKSVRVEDPLEDIFSSSEFEAAMDKIRDLDVYEVEVEEGLVGKENPFVE